MIEQGRQQWMMLSNCRWLNCKKSWLFVISCLFIAIPVGNCQEELSKSNDKAITSTRVTNEKVLEWVDDLGSNQFAIREKAHEQLDLLGEEYLPILIELQSKSDDAEVKARLWSIIARWKNEIVQRNNREFLRTPNLPENHPYQGWKSFSKAVGATDRKARFTLLSLLESYPELVREEIADKQDAFRRATLVAGKITERLDIRGEVSDADGIALVYTAAMCEELLDDPLERTCHRVFTRFPFSRNVNPELNSKSAATIVALYSSWAEYAKDQQRILLACLNAGIPAARSAAQKVLKEKNATKDPDTFELAMQAIARFGKKEDAALVDQWLEDMTTIRDVQRIASPNSFDNSFEIYDIKACDLALASTMILNEFYPAELFPMFRSHPLRGYTSELLGLPSKTPDSYRTNRLKRWREILETQPAPPATLPRTPESFPRPFP